MELIKRGSYAEIVRHADNSNQVWKVPFSDATDMAKNEIEVLQALSGGPYIAKLIDSNEEDNSFAMPKYRDDTICNAESSLFKAKMFHQLLTAVAFMHDKGYVHRDLTEGNILFDRDDLNENIVIIDFGLAAKIGCDVSDFVSKANVNKAGRPWAIKNKIPCVKDDMEMIQGYFERELGNNPRVREGDLVSPPATAGDFAEKVRSCFATVQCLIEAIQDDGYELGRDDTILGYWIALLSDGERNHLDEEVQAIFRKGSQASQNIMNKYKAATHASAADYSANSCSGS